MEEKWLHLAEQRAIAAHAHLLTIFSTHFNMNGNLSRSDVVMEACAFTSSFHSNKLTNGFCLFSSLQKDDCKIAASILKTHIFENMIMTNMSVDKDNFIENASKIHLKWIVD